MHDADEDDDISSQPLLPYVGMDFDSIEDAQKFYNSFLKKQPEERFTTTYQEGLPMCACWQTGDYM